ncbi:MAG: hypothetical protein ABGX15_01975 [Paracoccaceae bacterium]
MSLKPVIPLTGDQRDAVRATVRQTISDGCTRMVNEHRCAPISTLCMMAEQSILAAVNVDREAAFEFFYAILDGGTCDTEQEAKAALSRKVAAFETLTRAAQLREFYPEGSA